MFLQDQKSGRTCLHVASEEANVELMKVLLAQPSSSSVVNVQVIFKKKFLFELNPKWGCK